MTMPTVLENALSLLTAVTICLASFGIGAPLLRTLRLAGDDRLSNAVWSLALGATAWGAWLTLLGLLGLLYAPLIGFCTMLAGFWGLGEAAQALYLWRDETLFQYGPDVSWVRRLPPTPAHRLAAVMAVAAVVACGGALVSALAPPTAGDALCYHLELPKVFLQQHGLTAPPYDDNATYPLLVEMWFLWALALDGPVAAQLVHWLLGLLLGLATVELAAPVLGRSWAFVAGAVTLLIPGVTNQMTAPLNDAALAAYTTLAVAAWRRGLADDDSPRWTVAAGLMFGAALSIKYVAGVLIAALAMTTAILAWRNPARRRALGESLLTIAVVAVSVAGPWYVRAAWHRQNPVYPFLSSVFGQPGPQGDSTAKRPLGWRPEQLLAAPWQVTMQPERFGGRGHQLGPLLLATLPALLVARRLRGLRELLLLAAAFIVPWYALRQNSRFLLPVVPLLCTAVVWGLMETARWPAAARRALATTLAVLLAACVALPWVRARDQAAVALGLESRTSYLQRREPTFRAAALANAMLTPGDRLLSQDYRSFYFQMPVVRENIYRRRTAYDRGLPAAGPVQHCLRQQGFTHVLLAETAGPRGIVFDDTLQRLVDQGPEPPVSGGPICLTDYRFADADGQERRYRLLMLR